MIEGHDVNSSNGLSCPLIPYDEIARLAGQPRQPAEAWRPANNRDGKQIMTNWLKPNWLTIIFMLPLGLLIVPGASCSSCLENRCESTLSFGIGPCVEHRSVAVDDNVIEEGTKIHWHWLILNVLGLYFIGSSLSLFVRTKLQVRRSNVVFLSVIAATIAAAFIAGVICSFFMWGYFFTRPSIDKKVQEFDQIVSITPLESKRYDDGRIRFVIGTDYSIAESIDYGRKDPYYCLDERILIALEDSKKLPESPSLMSASQAASLYSLLSDTGVLRKGDSGYAAAQMLYGVAVEAKDKAGKTYLFFGGHGGQVSNDHYPYYEFLFDVSEESDPVLVSHNQFFYDMAGMEGFEWYAMFPIFAVLGLIITMPGTMVVLAIRKVINKGKHVQ